MPNLGNFRQYNETDVINLFKYAGSYPVNKGTFVKIGSGVMSDNTAAYINTVASVGGAYGNVQSTRWGLQPFVMPVTSSGDAPIGMLLYDGRESDENGEKLLFNPRKAAEMGVFISGQAAPIVTKGVFLYSGIGGTTVVPVTGGAKAYLAIDASIQTQTGGVGATVQATQVGRFLGPNDSLGFAMVSVNVQ